MVKCLTVLDRAKTRSTKPLFIVYEHGLLQFVARIIADGSYRNIPNFYRDALQAAAYFGHEKEVGILLSHGVDLNA